MSKSLKDWTEPSALLKDESAFCFEIETARGLAITHPWVIREEPTCAKVIKNSYQVLQQYLNMLSVIS